MTRNWFTSILLLTFCLVLAGLLDSGARVSEFQARRENNTVVLEWTTEVESNLLRFDIQRSTDGVRWLKIGEKSASGESSNPITYSYIDRTVFKSIQSNFSYKLLLIDKDGQSIQSDVVSVSGSSGIVHTWGSIKAMFR